MKMYKEFSGESKDLSTRVEFVTFSHDNRSKKRGGLFGSQFEGTESIMVGGDDGNMR